MSFGDEIRTLSNQLAEMTSRLRALEDKARQQFMVGGITSANIEQRAIKDWHIETVFDTKIRTAETDTGKTLRPDGLGAVYFDNSGVTPAAHTHAVPDDLTTAETSLIKVLQPDGLGGMAWTDTASLTSLTIGLNTLDTNEWAYLDGQDQAVKTTSNVTHNNLTLNGGTVTLGVDTNFVLTGGVNGVSFDTDTLSIDGFNGYVGIGTTAPEAHIHINSATGNNPTLKLSDDDVTTPDYSSVTSVPPLGAHDVGHWTSFSSNAGGIQLRGYTAQGVNDDDQPVAGNVCCPIAIIGYHGGTAPVKATIKLIAYKWNGVTDRVALADSEIIAQICNTEPLPKVTVLGNGYVGIGTAAPEANLHVHSIAGTNPSVFFTDADITSPDLSAAGLTADHLIGRMAISTIATGGLQINGFSSVNTNNGTPLNIFGYHGGTAPTTAAINLIAYKWNGATNRAAIADAEILLQMSNAIGSPKFAILGNGDTSITGDLQVNGGYIGISTDTDLMLLALNSITFSAPLAMSTFKITGLGDPANDQDAETKKHCADTYEPIITPKGTAFNTDFGTGAGDTCEGDDSRLSDTRTPSTGTDKIWINSGRLAGTTLGVYLATHQVTNSATIGLPMLRAGSITGLAVVFNCTIKTSDGDVTFNVRVNNSIVFSQTVTITATGVYTASSTQAAGVDTFVADDLIQTDVVFDTFVGTIGTILTTTELQI